MKTFLLTFKLVALFIVFSTFSYQSFSQCGTGTNNGVITPVTTWQNVTGASGTYAYWSFTGYSGSQYEFHNCSGVAEDTYLRIYNSSWSQIHAADDQCSSNASMTQAYGLRWTCSTGGTYYIFFTHYSCSALSYNQRMDYWSDYNPYDYDAGVSAVLSPATPVSPGVSTDVIVKIKNYGSVTLTSAGIEYKVDNGTVNTYSGGWTGSLTQGQESGSITIGAGTYGLGVHTIKAWTNNPSGQTDQNANNDTLTASFTVCQTTSGTFYIDNTGAGDFLTFNDALNSIQSCGINGPVTFIVRPGNGQGYNERLVINPINGGSATNTVTFLGMNKNTCRIYYNGNYGTASTIKLNGADYIRFDNLTIENTGTSYGVGVSFMNGADNNILRNCTIKVPQYAQVYNYYGCLVYFGNDDNYPYGSGSMYGFNNIVDNNLLDGGGYYAFSIQGTGYTTNFNTTVKNNTFINQYYYTIYLQNNGGTKILNNKFNKPNSSSGYTIYSYYGFGDTIMGNDMNPGQYGIMMYYENYNNSTFHSLIANNMISDFAYPNYNCGMYIYYCYNTHILHNTIWVVGTSQSTSYACIYVYYYFNGSEIKNNILISTGYSLLLGFTYPYNMGAAAVDYNDYYYPITSTSNYYKFYMNGYYNYYDFTSYKNDNNYFAGNHDQNSYDQKDPEVVSMQNLHLVSGNNGLPGLYTYNSVKVDFDKAPRCALASFLGADEPIQTIGATDFITSDTVCYVTPITFFNKGNEKSPHIASWYVDNVYKSSDFHFKYSFNAPGYDSVKLVMQTCAGISSKAKKIYVGQPIKVPSTEFVASKNVVEANEAVYINDVSVNCPTKWRWEISPDTVMDPYTKIMVPAFDWLNSTNETSQNLAISFKYSGKYSVCLVTENGIGAGNQKCKTDYINVKFIDNMCGALNKTTELYGSLYDDGGATANFTANGQTCKYLIKTCSDDVKITFKEFNLPAGSYLRLFDGINNRGVPMWDAAYGANGITGLMNDPKFDTVLWAAKSGMVYVEFQKGTASGIGFKLEWESFGKGSYSMPHAEFTSFDTGCIVYPVAYKNISLPGVNDLEFAWDFDGNSSIDANTIDGSYLPTFTGLQATYNTKLTAENCGGIDTFIKSIVLINPVNISNSAFTADVTQPVIYQDEVTFTTTGPRLECVNKWNWIINPSGKYYFAQGYSSSSEFPEVVFTDTVCYDVTLIVGNTNSASTQTIFKPCYIKPITYCTPKVLVKHQDIGISRVKIGSIDNSSDIGTKAYTSYTNLDGTDLFVGQKYEITVERITNFNAINRKVWIDYNSDGIFEPVNEMVASQDSSRTRTWTDSFIVPSNAPYGATIMRIGTAYANYSNTPCGANYFGEFEDYRVFVKQDNIPPVITLIGSDTVYVEKGYPYTDDGATAIDNIDGNLTNYIISTNDVDTTKTGTYHYNFNVCDFLNNCAKTVKRTIIVTEDNTPPILTLIGNDTILWNVNIPFVDPGFTAFDKGDGDITSQVMVNSALNSSKLGTYSIVYSIADSRGLKDTKTRTIIVLDGAAPSISLIGANPIYVNINSTYTEPGVVYADNYWPNNKIILQVTGLVDVTTVGTYPITYSVTDASGNGPNTISRDVVVYDSMSPVISTSGDDVITLEVYNQFYDPGVNIQDNSINGLTVHKYGNFYDKYPNGYPTKIGNYIIFYYVTDQAGNISNTLGRIVQVVDATAPKLQLIGNDYVFIQRWQTYTDAGYTLSDNYDANKDIVVDVQTNVNTIANGLYSVCYTATDLSGNQSPSVCRLVRVVQEWSGINDPSASNGINVYPNPTTGKFIIELTDNIDNARIVLINLLGDEVKLISDGTISTKTIEVNMNDLSNGVYMLKVQTDSKTIIERVVLSR